MIKKIIFATFLFTIIISACDRGPEVTFAKDVAPIIYENCTPCHRPGTAAPFDLIDYKDIAKRSKMIAFVTESNYMPPWPADPNYRHFLDEKFLTAQEKEILSAWHRRGAPLGNPDSVPSPPSFPERSQLGKPDMTIPVTPYLVKGNNRDKFLMIKVPYELPADTFVRVAEFVAGSNDLVHHMNGHLILYEDGQKADVFEGERIVDTEAFIDVEGFEILDLLNDDGSYPTLKPLVCNYLPGVVASVYPEGIGGFRLTAKGAFLINDMHYAPSPRDAWDSSYINLFFMDKPPVRPTRELQMGTLGISEIVPPLVIPPDTIMEFFTEAKVYQDISLLTINPHMHLLGKRFKAYAVDPTGDTIPLIYIPEWDFHWQYFYTFEKMLKIPAGSKIRVEAVFDNTANNPDNPYSPPQTIAERNGSMRTTDEMLQFIMTFVPYQPGDENISLDNEYTFLRGEN